MIADMVKIQLAVPRSNRDELMTWLQEQEILHITEIKGAGKENRTVSTVDQKMAYIQFALEFIKRLRKELDLQPKKSWRNTFAGKPVATLARLEQTIKGLSINKINSQIRKISDNLAHLKARKQEISDTMLDLHPWRKLSVTGTQLIKGSVSIHYVLLTIGIQEDIPVKRALANIKTAVWQDVNKIVTKKRGRAYLEVAVHRTEKSLLENIITTTSAEVVNLLVPAKQTVAEYAESLQEETKSIKKQCETLLAKGKRFFKIETELQFAYDSLLHRQERELIEQKTLQLPRTIIITGWVPKHTYKTFSILLEKDFPQAAVEIERKPKGTPPVALKNSKNMEPFEAVTNIYGKPKYSELDPTGPLSLFFLVAFGLALTDAGYGLVMMAIMGLAEKYFRLKKEMKKMIRLLFYAGASTVLFGALTGGWFGITLENLPDNQIKSALLSLKVIDPISQPMTLLMITFGVGIIQLLFAWIVRGYDHARNKNYVAMVFDDIAWFVMVVLLMLWVASSKGLLLAEFTQPILMSLYGTIAIVVLTGGRAHKNPALKLGAGVLSLYGLVSFVSDTLSYSRLLALGLATGIIGLVVNMLGVMVGTAIPGIGWILAVVVLIGGHTFNLGINALGAFIHSGRLQYVEFFPKFLEGGGVPYRPFGRVSKYVDNPKEFV